MTDPRGWSRRVLRAAGGEGEPDLASLRAAIPSLLARARTERAQARPTSTLEAVLPLGRRLLPALAAAAASLALAAFVLGRSTAAPAAEEWETSLVAQAADEAGASEILAEELLP